MDKRYQVFVSSTYEDLQEERKEVMQALLELDCIPAGMELFPASNDDQWTLIKRVIDDCDYYLLIIGGRYGSTNKEGKSYTQMEFEYALETGKPIISFLPKNPDAIPSGKCDKESKKKQKLEEFKEKVKSKMIKYWENPENLGSVVSRSMVRLIKDFPTEGWVKSGSAIDEKSVHEIARLQRENEELKERLKNVSTEAPKGTENFSQGDDEIKIEFNFSAQKRGYLYSCKYNHTYTWNELFSYIAPSMIDECIEDELMYNLNKAIEDKKDCLINDSNWNNYKEFRSFQITSESFNLVKIQFRALGMICLSEKKRTASDRNTYWKLTPYGNYVITQLLAIKR